MMTKEMSTKTVFHDPRVRGSVLGCGHISHIVKMHYFFKNLLVYSQVQISETKRIVMMTKERFTNIVIFMPEVLVMGHGHIVNMQYFFSSYLH